MPKIIIDLDRVPTNPEAKRVAKEYCVETLEKLEDMVDNMKSLIFSHGYTHRDAVILLVNADDEIGRHIVAGTGSDEEIARLREQGLTPYVAEVVKRPDLQRALDFWDKEAASTLRGVPEHTAVVVIDYGVVAVFIA